MGREFSIRRGRVDADEIREALSLAEKYFSTSTDPEQAQATSENALWLRTHIASCLNIIRHEGEIIGFTLVYPCSKDLMKKFVSKKINESQLFEELRASVANRKPETIYLCSAFVVPEFRRNGLALRSVVMSIKNSFNLKSKPPVFYWAYSQEGGNLAMKVAHELGLPIYKRTD